MGSLAYNYIHDAMYNKNVKNGMTTYKNPSDDPIYRYYQLHDIIELDAKVAEAYHILIDSDDATSEEKSKARATLGKIGNVYSSAQL